MMLPWVVEAAVLDSVNFASLSCFVLGLAQLACSIPYAKRAYASLTTAHVLSSTVVMHVHMLTHRLFLRHHLTVFTSRPSTAHHEASCRRCHTQNSDQMVTCIHCGQLSALENKRLERSESEECVRQLQFDL